MFYVKSSGNISVHSVRMQLSAPEKYDDVTISSITGLKPFSFETRDQVVRIHENVKDQVIDYLVDHPDFFNGKTFTREQLTDKYTQSDIELSDVDSDFKIIDYGTVKFQGKAWWIEELSIKGVVRLPEPIADAPVEAPVDDCFF